jgi:hypothetical protein
MYRENRLSDVRTLPGGVHELLPLLGYILTMCVKLDTDVQELLLSLPEFRDSRCIEIQRLLKGVNNMLPYFVPLRPLCMKFGTGDVHKNVLTDFLI